MKTKLKPDFLSDLRTSVLTEKIDLPGMKQKTYARALSAAEVRRISAACLLPGKTVADADAFDTDRLTECIVAAAIVDAKGHRLIPEGRESEMYDLPNRVYTTLQSAALRANGMGGDTPGN